jgi:hypothetical protein
MSFTNSNCIGENTKEMFLLSVSSICHLEKTSNIVRRTVEKDCSYDFIMD